MADYFNEYLTRLSTTNDITADYSISIYQNGISSKKERKQGGSILEKQYIWGINN